MLGHFLGIILVLTVASTVIVTDVFADSIMVEFDKELYYPNDSLLFSGTVTDIGMPIIAMSVYDPDGKILSANNIEISSDKTFFKSLSLDPPFYEKIGEYTIKLDYGQISDNYYFIVDGENSKDVELVVKEDLEIYPEIILLNTDKEEYADNDVITINGLVSALDSPTVLIGVYDPFEAPIGFYFGTIDSNLEFSTNFLVKSGINFRIDGTYSIKAHYAETEAISYFNFQNDDEVLYTTVDDLEKDIIKNQQSEEKLKESSDELVSEIDNIESQHYQQNNTDKVIDNNDTVSKTPTINNSQHSDPNYDDDNSILQSPEQKILVQQQPKNPEIQKTKIINEKNNTKETISKTQIKKNTNLTVEDIELGKLLNQINLECDSSIFVDTISYYDGMGPALYRLCNFDSSLNFFNKFLIENPDDVEILVNKGSTLGKLGYFSEAIIYYDQAIKFDPDFLPAKNNKANALANLGNFEEAILLYNEILEKNPSYSTAKLNLATTISMIPHTTDIVDLSSKPNLEKISFEESSLVYGKSDLTNNKNQKSSNFFEDVGVAFSSLGSLFDFLN